MTYEKVKFLRNLSNFIEDKKEIKRVMPHHFSISQGKGNKNILLCGLVQRYNKRKLNTVQHLGPIRNRPFATSSGPIREKRFCTAYLTSETCA